MSEATFRRCYLNQWVDSAEENLPWPRATWERVEDAKPEDAEKHGYPRGGVWLGCDADPERAQACIVACDSRGRAELVEQRNGADWVAERVREICARQHDVVGVAWVSEGPLRGFGDRLSGVRAECAPASAGDACEAAARAHDAVMAETLSAVYSGGAFEAALLSSRRQPRGSQWAIARVDRTAYASPLIALALAYWGATKPPKKRSSIAFPKAVREQHAANA